MKNLSKKANTLPFVSIIIPCRNEEHFIKKCLLSIIKNDYPSDRLEILLVDGASEDKTKKIVREVIQNHPYIKLLNNPKRITPCALNIGIKNAKGDFIVRMDAHSVYKSDYISSCIKYQKEYDSDNVGGIFASIPPVDTLVAKGIALALSHPFGVGNSYFRTYPEEIKEVDTVAFGCYKREVFDKIGLFNENLARSQDMEFNIRLKRSGGKIILFPDIIAYYYTDATLKAFLRHNFLNGVWAIYPAKFTKRLLKPRHLVPFFFILTLFVFSILSIFYTFGMQLLLLTLGLYVAGSIIYSIHVAFRKKRAGYLFVMPLIFAMRHFAYGIGSLWGLIKLVLP